MLRLTPATYEVTVPVVVKVVGEAVVSAEVPDGFPGFHSEAEDAGGVFDADDDCWDEEAEDVSRTARNYVKGLLT